MQHNKTVSNPKTMEKKESNTSLQSAVGKALGLRFKKKKIKQQQQLNELIKTDTEKLKKLKTFTTRMA